VVFKRRTPRSWLARARQLIYPAGGFWRAAKYLMHRMRRLPDKPHRIARGVLAGVFVNFPPIFGAQAVTAALFAWIIRGNILAAVLCTFISNPLTTPFIAVMSLEIGYRILGLDEPLAFRQVVAAFSHAGQELWRNARALFTDAPAEWASLGHFWRTVYLPYLVGSIGPGILASVAAYHLTVPLVAAWQKLRATRLRDRIEAIRRARAAKAEAAQRITPQGGDDGDAAG